MANKNSKKQDKNKRNYFVSRVGSVVRCCLVLIVRVREVVPHGKLKHRDMKQPATDKLVESINRFSEYHLVYNLCLFRVTMCFDSP